MRIKETRELAISLMKEHGLWQKGWIFKFDTATRRFGCCHYEKKIISLSAPISQLNDEPHVRNTILHEIAHALVGRQPGRTAHHGDVWRQTAVSIGCTGDRTYSAAVVAQPRAKYAGKCPGCGRVIQRTRRINISCGQCSHGYNPAFKFEWSERPI